VAASSSRCRLAKFTGALSVASVSHIALVEFAAIHAIFNRRNVPSLIDHLATSPIPRLIVAAILFARAGRGVQSVIVVQRITQLQRV